MYHWLYVSDEYSWIQKNIDMALMVSKNMYFEYKTRSLAVRDGGDQ